MNKLALLTAIMASIAVATPAMAKMDHNSNRYRYRVVQKDASDHKYIKYNNGKAYGKYKHKPKKAYGHYYTKPTYGNYPKVIRYQVRP